MHAAFERRIQEALPEEAEKLENNQVEED